MKKQILLKQFEYAIPVSALAITGIRAKHIAGHLPLMKVNIDFENGSLAVEGDWQFMMAANQHNEASWFRHHRGRVKIETALYAACAVNLDDEESDGLFCPLQGSIKDGDCIGACSGLLIVDNVRTNNGLTGNQWNISFYIYDVFDNYEIKFKLPVYSME
ncbi:MAG: hypothetical protein H7Y86_19115 [Rhizobacter sp.]|nr:hypothetical protein [Ferruginibacter sp.]